MIDTVLVIVTLASLGFALAMGVVVWRLLRLEQKRSASRVEALRMAADEADAIEGLHPDSDFAPETRPEPLASGPWMSEESGMDGEGRGPSGPGSRIPGPARGSAPLWTDLVIEQAAAVSRATDDRIAAAHLFKENTVSAGNGRRLVAGLALATTFLALAGAVVVSMSKRAAVSVQGAAAAPPLELLSLEHVRAQGHLAIRGVVRNPVERGAMADLVAVVFLFDRDGRYLGTVKQPMPEPVLSPGADAAFEVAVSDQLPVGRYRVTFHTGRGPVPHLDRRAAAPRAPASPEKVTVPPRGTPVLSAAASR